MFCFYIEANAYICMCVNKRKVGKSVFQCEYDNADLMSSKYNSLFITCITVLWADHDAFNEIHSMLKDNVCEWFVVQKFKKKCNIHYYSFRLWMMFKVNQVIFFLL